MLHRGYEYGQERLIYTTGEEWKESADCDDLNIDHGSSVRGRCLCDGQYATQNASIDRDYIGVVGECIYLYRRDFKRDR